MKKADAHAYAKECIGAGMGMRMKKSIMALILIIGLMAAQCGVFSAYAQESETAARSDGQTASYELFLPETYEQYLELDAPSDIALSEDYIAIADQPRSGNSVIYVLQKSAARYVCYQHNNNNAISGLNFYYAEDGSVYLFFFGAIGTVSWLNCEDSAQSGVVDTSIRPYSMIINGKDIYYTQANDTYSDVYHSTIEETDGGFRIEEPNTPLQSNLSGNSAFSEYNGNVYLANGKQIYTCSANGLVAWYSLSLNSVSSFAITATNEKQIVYIGAENMYVNDDPNKTFLGEFSVVKLYDGKIFVIENDKVRQFDLTSSSFTEYMIGKFSDYSNRLDDARDISSYGNKTVIADYGNGRVSVYGEDFEMFSMQYPADLVCAGEDYFLAAAGSVAYLYDYTDPVQAAETFNLESAAVGVAYSFGKFYIVTTSGSNTYEIDTDSLTVTGSGTPNITSPLNLTADLYGNLYVLTANGQVNRYTRDRFLSQTTASSELVAQFGDGVHDLFVDYSGTVYAASDSAIYVGSSEFKIDAALNQAVYSAEQKTIKAFTFEQEGGTLCILSDGFVVKTDLGENAPKSLKNISAEGLYDTIHSAANAQSAQGLYVTVPAGSTMLSLNAQTMDENTTVIAYSDYFKLDADRAGIRIAELDGAGTVVAFFEYVPEQKPNGESEYSPTQRNYTLCLVLGDVEEQSVGGAFNDIADYTGYTTNAVGLYRFPTMSLGKENNPVTTQTLSKNQAVTVLAKLNGNVDGGSAAYGLDSNYYFVKTQEGAYGFVPARYVLPYNPAPGGSTDFSYRDLAKGKSVTLYAEDGTPLTLSDREQLKVYGTADENGMIYAEYTAEDGKLYAGTIEESALYRARESVVIVLVAVTLVTAAVLSSVCYLILRKQPTLQ